MNENNPTNKSNALEDISLLALYLGGWEEDSKKYPGKKVFRAWKGFKFEILNSLTDQKMIIQFKGGHSVLLTDTGKEKAIELARNFGLDKEPF